MKIVATYILTIAVFLQSLLPRTAAELLHLPEVWAHYHEHQQEQKQPLSIWQFLQMHYAVDSKHTKQHKHHLPSFDLSSAAGFFVLPVATIELVSPSISFLLMKPGFYWENSYFFHITQTLICPPRI
ncbi:MAG: hypothetical protein U0X91_02695 [Spirosomataceae bacterium]